MDTQIRLLEVEADRALRGARIIGLIHTGRDEYDNSAGKYIEDSYVIAWHRDHHGGHAGEGDNWGTHRAQANNAGDVMLIHGNYDLPSREDALKDMLDRAKVSA